MTKKSRIEELDDLLTGLGMLVDPIRRLIYDTEDPKTKIPYIRSQFIQDLPDFRAKATDYCRVGKHNFGVELDSICRKSSDFTDFFGLLQHPELREEARRKFPEYLKQLKTAIRAVPCEDPGVMLPAESPLKTYLRLRAICSSATSRVELFDPYLSTEVFHRYLCEVGENTPITVVTSEKIMVAPKQPQDIQRRDQIVTVSELLALERPTLYRFYVTSKQHDRHLRADDSIFHLGGSVKDASKATPYTISTLEATESNHNSLDSLISNATEWFGPNVTTHRCV